MRKTIASASETGNRPGGMLPAARLALHAAIRLLHAAASGCLSRAATPSLPCVCRAGRSASLATSLRAPSTLPPSLCLPAVYEAARALVGYITPHFDEIQRVSVCPGGVATGYTYFLPLVRAGCFLCFCCCCCITRCCCFCCRCRCCCCRRCFECVDADGLSLAPLPLLETPLLPCCMLLLLLLFCRCPAESSTGLVQTRSHARSHAQEETLESRIITKGYMEAKMVSLVHTLCAIKLVFFRCDARVCSVRMLALRACVVWRAPLPPPSSPPGGGALCSTNPS